MTPIFPGQEAADTVHVVHGVDATGAYLGLVLRSLAVAAAAGPPPAAGWLWIAGAWQRPAATIDAMKVARWAQMKVHRAHALAGTFEHDGKVFDIDQLNITGAALRATRALSIGAPFSQLWVLADNSTTTLDAVEMIAMGDACAAAVGAVWATGIALRNQIMAAQSAEDVTAVAWPT